MTTRTENGFSKLQIDKTTTRIMNTTTTPTNTTITSHHPLLILRCCCTLLSLLSSPPPCSSPSPTTTSAATTYSLHCLPSPDTKKPLSDPPSSLPLLLLLSLPMDPSTPQTPLFWPQASQFYCWYHQSPPQSTLSLLLLPSSPQHLHPPLLPPTLLLLLLELLLLYIADPRLIPRNHHLHFLFFFHLLLLLKIQIIFGRYSLATFVSQITTVWVFNHQIMSDVFQLTVKLFIILNKQTVKCPSISHYNLQLSLSHCTHSEPCTSQKYGPTNGRGSKL